MELAKRKPNRLVGYDYATCGAYFITICTAGHTCMFWADNVGADIIRPQNTVQLSVYGNFVNDAIRNIPHYYSNVEIDKYCVMPNHVHMIILMMPDEFGRIISAPTISTVVGQMKRWVSKQIGYPVWQKSFYDHIICNEHEYQQIWTYIDSNPALWLDGKDTLCQ
ncbi:transposase [Ruminococcus sp.]|uniref:transposase n=1 Tax=Ruminococcus sp. TaxID=41978 RepID=UPI0025D92FE5|nr:transposase [Ruminococcus sp.]